MASDSSNSAKDASKAHSPSAPPPQTIAELKKTLKIHYETVDKTLGTIPPLMELEAWTKIHRIRLIIYGVTGILYLILIMNNLGGNILTHALGFFYPALESIKAADKGHKEDCQQWLSFWVILSGLTLVEYTDQALLTMLPYYFLFKVLLVCWLMLPQFRGAHRVYINCLKFLHSHTPKSEVHSGDSKGGDGADKKKKSHPESAPAHKEESQAHASSSSSANKRAGWQYTPLSRVVR